MPKTTNETQQDKINLAVLGNKMDNLDRKVGEISSKLDADYVTKDALKLLELRYEQVQKQTDFIQKIVYGVIGLIATTVISGIVITYINSAK